MGYTDFEVGLHYLELTLLIAVTGAALGLGTGAWLGRGLTAMYVKFYRMPGLAFHMSGELAASAVIASLAAQASWAPSWPYDVWWCCRPPRPCAPLPRHPISAAC